MLAKNHIRVVKYGLDFNNIHNTWSLLNMVFYDKWLDWQVIDQAPSNDKINECQNLHKDINLHRIILENIKFIIFILYFVFWDDEQRFIKDLLF